MLGTKLAKHSKKLLEAVMSPADYGQKTLDDMYRFLHHMSNATCWRAYDSTDNYSMPERFPDIDTRIVYWYGEKEKKDRKPNMDYVKKHIPGVVFREFPEQDSKKYDLYGMRNLQDGREGRHDGIGTFPVQNGFSELQQ